MRHKGIKANLEGGCLRTSSISVFSVFSVFSSRHKITTSISSTRMKQSRVPIESSFTYKSFTQPDESFSCYRLIAVVAVGGVLGMILSFAVNSVLFEISLNRFFAFYFGIIYVVLGVMMLLRSFFQPTMMKKVSVFFFSALVVAAGICSLVFQVEWLWTLSPAVKILIFSILGIATSFTITFAYVDLLSFCHDTSLAESGRTQKKMGLFESSFQVWLVLLLSIVTGLTYGFTFGLQEEESLEVAKTDDDHVNFFLTSLGHSLAFSLPFGFILGAVGAGVNEHLRHKEILGALKAEFSYKPVSYSDIEGA